MADWIRARLAEKPDLAVRALAAELGARGTAMAHDTVFRPAMPRDLDRAACLTGARAIWSQWDGYLKQPRGDALQAELTARGIPLTQAHTSGHASIPNLQCLAAVVALRLLVPIHTFEPGRFPALFGPRVALEEDGVWWSAAPS